LNEKSYYTGQLRRKEGTHVPHGQGLLWWVEDDKDSADQDNASQNSGDSKSSHNNSYYKGQFLDGFRHGLGEMLLRAEGKHFFGSFEYGSWEGMGSLVIRSRGFSYFGSFKAGEMTGNGRCTYRAKEQGQWRQKIYSGEFKGGRAHGRGVITDYMSGKIEVDREFQEEDLFLFGVPTPTAAAQEGRRSSQTDGRRNSQGTADA